MNSVNLCGKRNITLCVLTRLLVSVMCLSLSCPLFALFPADSLHAKSTEEVKLIHSDVLYKNRMDVRADVLVGHVRLYHDGMYLDCDSARFYKDENTFNAYGNVKMMQGDTLTLTSDTLLYDGPMMQAHALGNAVLTHRNTQLTTAVIDYDRWEGVGPWRWCCPRCTSAPAAAGARTPPHPCR